MNQKKDMPTSWNPVGKWYDEQVGEKGHFYHQTLILPNSMRLFDFQPNQKRSLLDLACGQGVLSRHLPPDTAYVGVDIAADLIQLGRRYSRNSSDRFLEGSVTEKLPVKETDFTDAAIILALQNIENPLKVFENAARHLKADGRFLLVLNHPCFRIPRQSSWGIDESKKIQYRRIDLYMSELKIPIQTHPGKGKDSSQTWSFHHSLSALSKWLFSAGFTIDLIEEWCSPKSSSGSAAKMENRSREEIPLFMAILARKI